jgi:hypothetical protein
MSVLTSRISATGALLGVVLLACGHHPFAGPHAATPCTDDTQCAFGHERCDLSTKICTQLVAGAELGTGAPGSVTITDIHTAPNAELVDLAFNEDDRSQVWLLSYSNSHVHIGAGVLTGPGTWRDMRDPAYGHFMYKPTALAWGSNGLWATCGDNDNAQNDERGANEPNYFMGPSLFTSDLSIFTKNNPKTNLGSHVDMLHNTSFCRGIAHMTDNIFWTFNGELGSVEKYNFNQPHEPGGDDHSDGEIYRYVQGQLKGVDGVPSHLAYDDGDKFLYIADTGNKRIVRLDTNSGTLGDRLPRRNEPLKSSGIMNGTNVQEVVPPGLLEMPSGIEVWNDHVYVSDTAQSRFYCFDKTGKEIRRFDTGLPPKSLAGFALGADNRIWFVDRTRGKLLRLDVAAAAPSPQ